MDKKITEFVLMFDYNPTYLEFIETFGISGIKAWIDMEKRGYAYRLYGKLFLHSSAVTAFV